MSGTKGKFKIYTNSHPFIKKLLMASYETKEEAEKYLKKYGKKDYYIETN